MPQLTNADALMRLLKDGSNGKKFGGIIDS